jgi:hypothetical protein
VLYSSHADHLRVLYRSLAEAVEACETRARSRHLLTDTPFQGQSEMVRANEMRQAEMRWRGRMRRVPGWCSLVASTRRGHWRMERLSYLVDRSWISLPPMIGLAAQVIFAMFPVIQVWRR